ncbi:hypothetical protein [Nocardia wallacei]|uniref:hypothetical protein n=1 Tax=Nocardia wallacei TaxID=480035 RepID=UPI0024589EE4|nr:hypothetical protein [Nocardia wallacei]
MTFLSPLGRVVVHDPAHVEDAIMTLLRAHGSDYVFTLAQASEFADRGERDRALGSLRDAAEALRRTGIDQADAENLVFQHSLALAAVFTADFSAPGRSASR